MTLLLLRETSHIEGVGRSLVHAFASPTHPEATGPVLEFSLPAVNLGESDTGEASNTLQAEAIE